MEKKTKLLLFQIYLLLVFHLLSRTHIRLYCQEACLCIIHVFMYIITLVYVGFGWLCIFVSVCLRPSLWKTKIQKLKILSFSPSSLNLWGNLVKSQISYIYTWYLSVSYPTINLNKIISKDIYCGDDSSFYFLGKNIMHKY